MVSELSGTLTCKLRVVSELSGTLICKLRVVSELPGTLKSKLRMVSELSATLLPNRLRSERAQVAAFTLSFSFLAALTLRRSLLAAALASLVAAVLVNLSLSLTALPERSRR